MIYRTASFFGIFFALQYSLIGMDYKNVQDDHPQEYILATSTKEEIKTLEQELSSAHPLELPPYQVEPYHFSVRTRSGKFIGGIQGKIVNWGILQIELLVVVEEFRHCGIGSLLLKHIESVARDHYCHIAHLSTFDFQAKDFYLKHGYSVFGTLENAPKGHCRYYMKKDL